MLRLSKADLNELSLREDHDTVIFLENHEVGDVYMILHYQRSLIAKNLFPECIGTFRFTSITRKYYISFSSHPDSIALLIATGDITSTTPSNSMLDEKFKVSYSLAESFKSL